MDDTVVLEALAEISRERVARLTATMTKLLGDFDLAEESVQDALLIAIERWPRSGVPVQPGAWLLTVARRKAIDRLRREAKYQEKLALLQTSQTETDDRVSAEEYLRLVFTCCHPALSQAAQVALTLRAVMGLTTAEIASAFLCPEATIAQRIVRAKRKIVEANIPYSLPAEPEWESRLDGVLTVLYLVFNEGYLSAGSGLVSRRNLAEEAAWLVSHLALNAPNDPEILGLLALMRLHLARAEARIDGNGELALLRDQDRQRWDRRAIADADALIERAAALRRPGRYQLQAAIAACHATADSWEATDWPQILALYERLCLYDVSPVARLNRAIALGQVCGAEAALVEVDRLAKALGKYHLFHATRGELLRALGRMVEARAADEVALELTQNPAERALLRRRLGYGMAPLD
ncbi:MAG TPA: sigma-70 family RNA polymerase sigma factor [Ktedonobacterales bacterium]|jgi:RNA polymerase sigma-70 factor (ECF subfamily)